MKWYPGTDGTSTMDVTFPAIHNAVLILDPAQNLGRCNATQFNADL